MAGEWLKMELATPDKPEIFRMARILSLDRDAVLGKLFRVWAWFDKNSVDGRVDGVVSTDVDALVAHVSFTCAMREVGWLNFNDDEQWVSLPHFDRHNGETAKKRALKNERQARWRENVGGAVDAAPSQKASTREEKRREEVNTITRTEKKPSVHAVEFDPLTGKFSGLNGQMQIWKDAYPAVAIEAEINKAAAWLVANPKNKKSNYSRFLANWLSRAQDKAPKQGKLDSSEWVST